MVQTILIEMIYIIGQLFIIITIGEDKYEEVK